MANPQKNSTGQGVILLWAGLVFIVFSACSIFGDSSSSIESTRESLEKQQTSLAYGAATLTQAAMNATPLAPAQATAGLVATPLQTDVPTAHPLVVTTPGLENQQGLDERTLKSARILLYEDMSASGEIRYVMEALDRMDLFYLDVGSAKGWFKNQLLSSQEWDLIIAAAEGDRNFGGEYFEYINDRVVQGAAAVIEFRDFDAAPNGLAKPFLDGCGVSYQADWFNPDLRVFFPILPEHPVFNEPNPGLSSWKSGGNFWKGDAGDLIKIAHQGGQPTGDAILLAGTNPSWKDDHGLLATCMDGRVILQTFASHDMQYAFMVSLWQNYIYQTLKARFAIAPSPAPTPVVTVLPSPTPLDGAQDILSGDVLSCGGLLTARLLQPPQLQADLFEHHANGQFMILRLEMTNQTDFPIHIWDQDYLLEGKVQGKNVAYSPDKAATGYLYIEGGIDLYQDLIQPGTAWRTALAFDIDPQGRGLTLVVRPGAEFSEQACVVHIPVTR